MRGLALGDHTVDRQLLVKYSIFFVTWMIPPLLSPPVV
jgi:hypothetical protein